MMRWRLNTLIGQLRDVNPKAAEYREIHKATGIAVSTVALLAKGSSVRTDLEVVNSLLNYFSEKLGKDLTTQDLLEFAPDKEGKK